MAGQVIVVTATSGAGKTTTCQTFARRSDDCYLMFGLDLLTGTMVAGKYSMFGDKARDFFYDVPAGESGPNSPAQMNYGPDGWRALHALHDMIATAAQAGQNVIVDHCTWLDPPVLQDCIWRLRDVPVLFVGLKPPANVLQKRLAERKLELPASIIDVLGKDGSEEIAKRLQAVTPWFYEASYANDYYDLVIDTARFNPDEVCAQIEQRLEQGPGTAFETLRQQHPRPSTVLTS